MQTDVIEIALTVAQAFDRVQAPYFLGGSMASSIYGEPRATNDIDFVVDLDVAHVRPFAAALGEDFAVDEEALVAAIHRRASWNIYYLPLVTKIDLFILGSGSFDQSEFSRRRQFTVRPDGAKLFAKSPEDTILRKLLWYLDGGEVSNTQWRDVVAVLRISARILDEKYLDEWAQQIGVAPLLARARAEARP